MIMRAIRKKKRAFKIPIILFTVALSISLVGLFSYSPLDTSYNPKTGQASYIQSMLDTGRQLEQAIKVDPDNAELQVNLGNTFYDVGAYYAEAGDDAKANRYFKEATAPYLKALEADPSLIGVRVDLATAAYYAGANEMAEEHFLKAIEQDSNFVNARLNYGHFLFYARDDAEGALEQWNKAKESAPDEQTRSTLEALISSAREHGQN